MKEDNTKKICPADRIATVEEYYFSRKLREVAAMNARGEDVISLGIGGPDRPPHESVIAALQQEASLPNAHGYQSYIGLPELRKAFADWYARFYGVVLNPDGEIQPLIGSKEGILHISMAFVNPGDVVLLPNPGYPTYTSVSRLVGADIHYYDLTEANGWMPDFDALERMPLDRAKIMWVNYPHMPTGARASLELFERLVDFGRRHGILIVNDNPYSFILNDKPLSILQVEGAKDVCIELNSLSKSHNMAGWRIGMLLSNADFVSWVLRVKSNVDSGQFRPMMVAAVEALKAWEDWFAQLNGEYARRRKMAERIMTALDCKFDPSQSGLFLWGRIPDHYADVEELTERVLHENKVFITPGFIFGSNGARYIRISLCATLPRMEEALQRILKGNK